MSFTLTRVLQNLLVDCLRDAFSKNMLYQYISNIDGTPDVENTQIAIYRSFPKILSNYPEVAIQVPRIPTLEKTLGNDFITATYGDMGGGMSGLCNEVYGGIASGEFSILISANTEAERDNIADCIISYLNHSHKWFLEERSVDVMNVGKQGEKIVQHLSDYIYCSEVSVSLFAEWSSTMWYSGDILEDVANCNVWISGVDGLPGLSNI